MDAENESVYGEEPCGSQLGDEHNEECLDVELEELRRVRRALLKMNQGMENVQRQIKYFNSNVSQTTQLLDIWVRVLSQTMHNQAYLQNPAWHGGQMDTAQLEGLVQRDAQREEEAERKRRAKEAEREKEREEAEARRERERRRAEQEAEAVQARPRGVVGRRPPPGPAARGRGAPNRRGTRGRGSLIPPATNSRIRPPR
ncbi:hypothetical protein GGH12_000671 [Coemansia sp. RSA 1822]|nr:hypothetical protein LPJ76_001565 [Coemansia sp. RSA 638]KAJ2545003.1 hypothetical protein GGF49_000762 [Coemansia sp. RSA 1853]KAJ2566713.1 hypothetical protein GGH12_000671 [Coemansia sp. RSA 1822]